MKEALLLRGAQDESYNKVYLLDDYHKMVPRTSAQTSAQTSFDKDHFWALFATCNAHWRFAHAHCMQSSHACLHIKRVTPNPMLHTRSHVLREHQYTLPRSGMDPSANPSYPLSTLF